METQEVITENSITESAQETMQDDYQLMNMIRSIKASSKDEVRTELATLQNEVASLQEQLSEALQRLEPLLKFEPILTAKKDEPVEVRLHKLSENDKEKLLALARQFYPNRSRAFDNGITSFERGRDPLNQLLSDLMSFLLIGPTEHCMLSMLFRGHKQRGLVMNDNA